MRVVAIGVSAGGPETLRKLFSMIGRLPLSILLAQHNLVDQVESFVEWLSGVSEFEIDLVKGRREINFGRVYVPAPGYDLVVLDRRTVGVERNESGITPSIDVLFSSVARVFGRDSVVVVLGGLGRDGVEGAKAVESVGGTVVVQSDAKFPFLPTSVSKSLSRARERTLAEIASFLELLAG